jgi:hypothetical protein
MDPRHLVGAGISPQRHQRQFGERSLFPLGNLITQRVLPDDLASDISRGAACLSRPLLQLSGKFANSDDQAMFWARIWVPSATGSVTGAEHAALVGS